MEALNEVYFGRGPIEPLQKQITKVRNKLAFKPVTSSTNMDPEVLKFNRLAEAIFGFNSFSLYIQPDNIPNAYAFPVDTYLTDEERKVILNSVISSPTGFKYEKAFAQVNLVIAIHTGLLDMTEITDEEIMATILHEIGHGFFEAVTDHECQFSTARKIINMMLEVTKFAKDKVTHGKFVTEKIIDMELSRFNSFVGSLKSKLDSTKNKIFKKFVHESMEDNMRKNRIDYTNEKFADTFAAMYGYGEECHSGDIKIFQVVSKEFYGVKTYSHLNEVIKMYKMYTEDFLAYIFNVQDPHPGELARIKTTADYLKRELAKEGLDPKMKKEMQDQLNKIYELIEAYKTFPKDQDSMRILRLYNIKLYEKFGGDRREKDTDNDALFGAIDKRYEGLAKRNEYVEYINEEPIFEMYFSVKDLQDPKTIDRIKAKKTKDISTVQYVSHLLKFADKAGMVLSRSVTDNHGTGIGITVMILCSVLSELSSVVKDIPDKEYKKNIQKYKREVKDLRDKMSKKMESDPKNAKEYMKVFSKCQYIIDRFDDNADRTRFSGI